MAISQELLRNFSQNYRQGLYKRSSDALALSSEQTPTAFLCHSHHDVELVKGLLVYFEQMNIKLYVDWLDEEMPETPNRITAEKIQKKIKGAELFFFLATENSRASRWCPWEMGYADGSKKSIYIIPTENGEKTFGNEYLQLYNHLTISMTTGYYTPWKLAKIDTNGNWIGYF